MGVAHNPFCICVHLIVAKTVRIMMLLGKGVQAWSKHFVQYFPIIFPRFMGGRPIKMQRHDFLGRENHIHISTRHLRPHGDGLKSTNNCLSLICGKHLNLQYAK